MTDFNEILAKAITEQLQEEIAEKVTPVVEKKIVESLGYIPSKVILVKKPRGIQKKVTGLVHEKFEPVLKLVSADIPVFLVGPAGTGKNYTCKQVADALKLPFYYSNAVTQEFKLTGFIDAGGKYHETQFFKAFTKGGVFMLDEVDASIPEVLIILNSAIANGYFDFPTGRTESHKDFRVIAAGNTFGNGADRMYVGRSQIDVATLDRFATIEFGYDKTIDLAMARGNEELVAFVHDLRKAITDTGIRMVISYRALRYITEMTEDLGICKTDALKYTILKGLSDDDRMALKKNVSCTSNPYYRVM